MEEKYFLAKICYPKDNALLKLIVRKNGRLIDKTSYNEIKKNGFIMEDGAIIHVRQDYTPFNNTKIFHVAERCFTFTENFLEIIKEITKDEFLKHQIKI